LDAVLDEIRKQGTDARMSIIDIKSAFRHVPIHPDDIPLMGFEWEGKYYFERALPFGLRSSPGIYDRLARALVYIAQQRGVYALLYYVDDHIIISPPGINAEMAHTFVQTAADIGIHIALDKLIVEQQIAPFVGFEINTIDMTVGLTDRKLRQLVSTLCAWREKHKATRKELERITGLLAHVSRVLPPGRTYTQKFYNAMRKLNNPRHHIRISSELREDLDFLLRFCAQWSGTALISRPFASHITAASDASSTIGAGGFTSPAGDWYFLHWQEHHNLRIDTEDERDASITFKELYALIILAAIAAPTATGHTLTILCDNTGAVSRAHNRFSRVPEILELVRLLIDIELRHDLAISAQHIPGINNTVADDISRGRAATAVRTAGLKPTATPLPPIILDYESNLRDRLAQRQRC
jgi:hypothetical protein